MKTNKRFIKSICETAAKEDVAMPWARGAKRKGTEIVAKHAA